VAAARRVQPGDARGPFLAALLAERAGDVESARREMKSVTGLVDAVPLEFIKYKGQILMLNGLSHFGLGEKEAARPYLEAYLKLEPAGPVAKLLARIQLEENNPAAAITTLEPYLRARPDDAQAKALLASAHLTQGRTGRAVAVAREALKSSDTAGLRAVLGMGLIRGGQVRNAQAELEAYHRKNPSDVGTTSLLASIYIRQGQGPKAAALIEPLRKRHPTDVGLTVLLGQARLASKDGAGARKAFDEAVAAAPRSKQAVLPLVHLDMSEGKPDAAAARMSKLLQSNDKDPELLFTMASIEEQRGKLLDAQRTLERANELSGPRDPRAGLALIDLHSRYKRQAEALATAKSLAARMADEVKPQLALARVLLAQGDRESAKTALSQATRIAPLEAQVQVEIGLLQMMAGQLPAAAYSLEKALQAEPGYLPAMAALTDVDIQRKDIEVARQRAQEVVRLHPKLAIGHSLQGDIAWATGDVKAAAAAFQRAHQLQPSTDTMVNVHRALRWRDGPAAAVAFGDQWLKARPQDDRARVVQAGLLATQGKPQQAQAHYEAVLKRRPNDAQVLNNLANVLLQVDKAAALPVAERALAAAPGDAGVIDTLGWVLLQNGQKDRALQLLRDARLRRPADPTIRYHLAEALVQAGRKDEAKAELDVALAAAPRFEGSEQARTLLQSLQR
jgi:putative PEP-CTERM system TPR-repeat lipoprotein